MPQDDFTELYSEILEKMIDSQIKNTEALTSFEASSEEAKEIVAENKKSVQEIKAYFTNGFRAEIKKHVTKEIDELRGNINEMSEKVNKVHSMLTKPAFWIKLLASIIIAFGAISAAIVTILKLI